MLVNHARLRRKREEQDKASKACAASREPSCKGQEMWAIRWNGLGSWIGSWWYLGTVNREPGRRILRRRKGLHKPEPGVRAPNYPRSPKVEGAQLRAFTEIIKLWYGIDFFLGFCWWEEWVSPLMGIDWRPHGEGGKAFCALSSARDRDGGGAALQGRRADGLDKMAYRGREGQ